MFRIRFAALVQRGDISREDADNFAQFVDLVNAPAFTMYIYGRLGQLPHLEQDPGYQATLRVMAKLGLDKIEIDRKSAQPYEEQFWEQYDVYMELTEAEMHQELPAIVVDPSNRAKVEAVLGGRRAAFDGEQSQKLQASL
jgi:hypothetical protein